MGQFFETIPQSLFKWIAEQKMFWVSTAPLSSSGHVNISPKGGEYFGLLDEKTFWYMDLTGSGSETIAHLYEKNNGRITVMFNAFEGSARILRLFGHGRVLESGTRPFDEFAERHNVNTIPGSRAIVLVDVHQVGTSCGFSVPFYDFKEFRPTLNDFFARKDEKFKQGNEKESMPRFDRPRALVVVVVVVVLLLLLLASVKLEANVLVYRYWASKNSWSMDGLPALHVAQKTRVQEKIEPLKKMVGPAAPAYYQHGHRFGLEHLLLVAFVTTIITAVLTKYGLDTARDFAIKLPTDTGRLIHSSWEL